MDDAAFIENHTHRSEDDVVQIEILGVRMLVVVTLLQGRNVSVACRDRVRQSDDATTPPCTRQPRAHPKVLGNVDQLVQILVAALVQRLQAVVRLHHQLRQLVDCVIFVVFIRTIGDVTELLDPNGFCEVLEKKKFSNRRNSF